MKLNSQLIAAVYTDLNQRFMHVGDLRNFNPDDIKKEREIVKAYVKFMHYVKPIYKRAAIA